VLAAYVDECVLRTHSVTGDQQPFDHPERIAVHEHAVFERTGLALVGIADHIAGPGIARCELPLQAGRESRAAAADQLAGLHLGDHLRGSHLAEDLAQRCHAALCAVVVQAGGVHDADVGEGHLDQPADLELRGRGRSIQQGIDRSRCMPRAVDQRGRRAVTQPQAADRLQRHRAIRGGLAGRASQSFPKRGQQHVAAAHRARSIDADADELAAHRFGMEHVVELGDAVDIGQGDIKVGGDPAERWLGQPAVEERLRVVQHFEQDRLPSRAVVRQDVFEPGETFPGRQRLQGRGECRCIHEQFLSICTEE